MCELLKKQVLVAFTEEEKLAALNEFQIHIDVAQKENDIYEKIVKESQEELKNAKRQEHHCNVCSWVQEHKHQHYSMFIMYVNLNTIWLGAKTYRNARLPYKRENRRLS